MANDVLHNKSIIMEKLASKKVIDFINKYNIISMILFGSITNDEFNEESDVDLALLSNEQIKLDNILDIELFLQNILKRDIDILDLRSDTLDLFVKINILNTGRVIYSKDNGEALSTLYDEADKIFRENENFIYFRKVDVLS